MTKVCKNFFLVRVSRKQDRLNKIWRADDTQKKKLLKYELSLKKCSCKYYPNSKCGGEKDTTWILQKTHL